MDLMDFTKDDFILIISVLESALYGLIAVAAGFLIDKSQPKVEKVTISWLLYDALTHFLIEGRFIVLALTGTVNSSDHFTALLWKEYGKADSRWLYSDPTIVSLELLTVTVAGSLCVALLYGIYTKAYWRHFVQIVLCVCELYGGWMTFVPEWLTGSPSLDTSNFMNLWVYLFFFNILWVIIPLHLLYFSWEAMWVAFSSVSHRQPHFGQDRSQQKSKKVK